MTISITLLDLYQRIKLSAREATGTFFVLSLVLSFLYVDGLLNIGKYMLVFASLLLAYDVVVTVIHELGHGIAAKVVSVGPVVVGMGYTEFRVTRMTPRAYKTVIASGPIVEILAHLLTLYLVYQFTSLSFVLALVVAFASFTLIAGWGDIKQIRNVNAFLKSDPDGWSKFKIELAKGNASV